MVQPYQTHAILLICALCARHLLLHLYLHFIQLNLGYKKEKHSLGRFSFVTLRIRV